MDNQFKKCPLCGSEVEIMSKADKQEFVGENDFRVDAFHFSCGNVECMLGNEYGDPLWRVNWQDAEVAAEAWNRRPLEEALEKRIQQLERGLEVLLHTVDQETYPELVQFAVVFAGQVLEEHWRE